MGKTSLIQAGLVAQPRDQEGFVIPPIIRLNKQPPPGQPDNRYEYSLCDSLGMALPAATVDSGGRETLAAALKRHVDALHAGQPGSRQPRTLLIFDQFEELLSLDRAGRLEREEFLSQLMEVLYDPRYWALFALREDYLAELEPWLVYFPDRLSTRFRLEFLQRADAVEALLKPVVPFGVTFQRDAAERLVEDLRQVTTWRDGKPENRTGLYVEPMYLQVVGVNLWKADRPDPAQITVQDVAIWGKVEDALREYFDTKVAEVAPRTGVRAEDIRDWLEYGLVTEQGIRGTVREGQESEFDLNMACVGN